MSKKNAITKINEIAHYKNKLIAYAGQTKHSFAMQRNKYSCHKVKYLVSDDGNNGDVHANKRQ